MSVSISYALEIIEEQIDFWSRQTIVGDTPHKRTRAHEIRNILIQISVDLARKEHNRTARES